jgi:uncharacterized membrane protein
MMTGLDVSTVGGGWLIAITIAGPVIAFVWSLVVLSRDDQGSASKDPTSVLKRRFARGEIDETEYERARRLLDQ